MERVAGVGRASQDPQNLTRTWTQNWCQLGRTPGQKVGEGWGGGSQDAMPPAQLTLRSPKACAAHARSAWQQLCDGSWCVRMSHITGGCLCKTSTASVLQYSEAGRHLMQDPHFRRDSGAHVARKRPAEPSYCHMHQGIRGSLNGSVPPTVLLSS
jgi:hypothetical protein